MLLIGKVVLLIVALILLLRWKVDLALSMAIVTVMTVLVFRIPLPASLRAVKTALASPGTWDILGVIALVQYVGSVQKKHRMFDHLIQSLNFLIRDKRLVAIVSPAIIGFLPMPGGALFSAPLVETSTREMKLKPAFSAFLNFWFRHDWELIWPLYAGLLLFQKMSAIPLKKIILYQFPFSLLHIATGLVIAFSYFRRNGIGRIGPDAGDTVEHHREMIAKLTAGTWPLLAVIVLFFVLPVPLSFILVGVALLLSIQTSVGPLEALQTLFSRTIVRSLLIIVAVMVFQEIIKASAAFDVIRTMHVSLGMVVLFIFLVAFTMGFLTGVTTAYVAIAFPVLLPLIQHLPNYFYLALYIYVIGFAGILCSPTHLCLVLTNEYFKTSLLEVYRYLAFPLASLIGLSTLLVLLIK